MKNIKTIYGDGFYVLVWKGSDDLYYVEMFDSGSCVVFSDYNTQAEALIAANLLVALKAVRLFA